MCVCVCVFSRPALALLQIRHMGMVSEPTKHLADC